MLLTVLTSEADTFSPALGEFWKTAATTHSGDSASRRFALWEDCLDKLVHGQTTVCAKSTLEKVARVYGNHFDQKTAHSVFQAQLGVSGRENAASIHALKQLLVDFVERSDPDFQKVADFVRLRGPDADERKGWAKQKILNAKKRLGLRRSAAVQLFRHFL